MATITKKNPDSGVQLGNTPWGNLSALRYVVKTNASGAVINSDSASAVAANDVVRLGLHAFDRNRPSVIYGGANRLLAQSSRLATRAFVAQSGERLMRPRGVAKA